MKIKTISLLIISLCPIILLGSQDTPANAPAPDQQLKAFEKAQYSVSYRDLDFNRHISALAMQFVKEHITQPELQDLTYSYLKNFNCKLHDIIEEDGICSDGSKILKNAIQFLNSDTFRYIAYDSANKKKIYRHYNINKKSLLSSELILDTMAARDLPNSNGLAHVPSYTCNLDEHILTLSEDLFMHDQKKCTAFYSAQNLHALGFANGFFKVIFYNCMLRQRRIWPYGESIMSYLTDAQKKEIENNKDISAICFSPGLKYMAIEVGQASEKESYLLIVQDRFADFRKKLKESNLPNIYSQTLLSENDNPEHKMVCFIKLPSGEINQKFERKFLFKENEILIYNRYDSHDLSTKYWIVDITTGVLTEESCEGFANLTHDRNGKYRASVAKNGITNGIRIWHYVSQDTQFIPILDPVAELIFSPTGKYLIARVEKDKKALLYIYEINEADWELPASDNEVRQALSDTIGTVMPNNVKDLIAQYTENIA
jgi:hypothetical protein